MIPDGEDRRITRSATGTTMTGTATATSGTMTGTSIGTAGGRITVATAVTATAAGDTGTTEALQRADA